MANETNNKEFSFDDTVESMVVGSEDQPATSSEDSIVYNSHATWSLITDAMDTTTEDILTPPPEQSPKEHYCASTTCTSPAEYVRGSSLEDSPLSSTSDREIATLKEEEGQEEEDASPQQTTHSDRESFESSDEDGSAEENSIPDNVKLPQRKGCMQLWQFLYTLLSDPDKKYGDLIQWTSNTKAREFRLLEPEAVAIWWGEHKNKRNMSYDKLSRSLRYYYDKGIIKKISGERYVYQFCIDPEVMYKHIGNSDSRPKLKPMPANARQATSKYQHQHRVYNLAPQDPMFVAQGPVSLASLHPTSYQPFSANLPFLQHDCFSAPPSLPPPPSYEESYMNVTGYQFGHFAGDSKSNAPVRRCRSFDSMVPGEPRMYEHNRLQMSHHLSPPPVIQSPYQTLSPTPSPLISPPSNGRSSSLPYNFAIPSMHSDEVDFDLIGEVITSVESFSMTSPPSTLPYGDLPLWNFS